MFLGAYPASLAVFGLGLFSRRLVVNEQVEFTKSVVEALRMGNLRDVLEMVDEIEEGLRKVLREEQPRRCSIHRWREEILGGGGEEKDFTGRGLRMKIDRFAAIQSFIDLGVIEQRPLPIELSKSAEDLKRFMSDDGATYVRELRFLDAVIDGVARLPSSTFHPSAAGDEEMYKLYLGRPAAIVQCVRLYLLLARPFLDFILQENADAAEEVSAFGRVRLALGNQSRASASSEGLKIAVLSRLSSFYNHVQSDDCKFEEAGPLSDSLGLKAKLPFLWRMLLRFHNRKQEAWIRRGYVKFLSYMDSLSIRSSEGA